MSIISTNMRALYSLFSAIPVHTDLKSREIKKLFLDQGSNPSLSTLLIKTALKEGKLQLCCTEELYKIDHGSFYFLSKDCSAFTNESGILAKGIEFDGSQLFHKYTVTDKPVESDWSELEENFAPCSAMLIIDRYIFGQPFESKINGLLDFLNFQKRPNGKPFQLTIITSTEKQGKQITTTALIEQAYQAIKSTLNIGLEIIVDNRLVYDDRLIYTDYTSANIGHPFDGRRTRYNQKFLANELTPAEIKKNYEIFNAELLEIKMLVKGTSRHLGIQQCRWPLDGIKNRLFDLLDE